MAKKISRKELLHEPDEFITTSTRVIEYARNNPKKIGFVVGLVVLAVVVVVAGYAYHTYKLKTSHEMFMQAYRNYVRAVRSDDPIPDEKLNSLFKEFDQIAKDFGSFVSGEKALLYTGHVLYMKKDYKGALERYERMKSTNLVKRGLGDLIMYNIAMTHIALGNYEEAKTLFEQLSKDPDSPYRREAYSSIASIYETMGKNKEAIQAYRQYLKMFPQAPDAAYVKSRISALAPQG